MASMGTITVPVEIVADREALTQFIHTLLPDCNHFEGLRDCEAIVSKMFVENVVMAGNQFVEKTLQTDEMTDVFQKNFEDIWNEGYEAGYTDGTDPEGNSETNPYEGISLY